MDTRPTSAALAVVVFALTAAVAVACGEDSESPRSVADARATTPQEWTMVELPTGDLDLWSDSGGRPTRLGAAPMDLNERGQIVGQITITPRQSMDVDERYRAVLWDKGRLVPLPTFPGDTDSSADAINERGEIVGWRRSARAGSAVLWKNGRIIDLGPGAPYGLTDNGHVVVQTGSKSGFLWVRGRRVELRFEAHSVNASGQIVGGIATGEADFTTHKGWGLDSAFRPALWQDDKLTTLETPPGFEDAYGFAEAINDRGEIAAVAVMSNGDHHLILWQGGDARDLGVIVRGGRLEPWDTVYVRLAMNERGQVAVSAEAHAFLADNGRLRSLPAGIQSVSGINNSGQIIGTSQSAGGEYHAFVWQDGRLSKLPQPRAGARVTAINERGEIVGADSKGRPVLWTPQQRTDKLERRSGGRSQAGDETRHDPPRTP